MANNMMVWAEFGRPNESVWGRPQDGSESPSPNSNPNHGLYPGGYHLFSAAEGVRINGLVPANEEATKPALVSWKDQTDKLWKGWVLPASDGDTWFVAGSAAYYRTLQSKDVHEAVEAERIRYRGLNLAGDVPANYFRIEEIKGVLFLDALRQKIERHEDGYGPVVPRNGQGSFRHCRSGRRSSISSRRYSQSTGKRRDCLWNRARGRHNGC